MKKTAKVVGKQAHHAKPANAKKKRKHAAGAASTKHAAHLKHLSHEHAVHMAHLAHLKHIGKAPPAAAKGLPRAGFRSLIADEGRSPVATRHEGFERRGLLVPPAAAAVSILDDIPCCSAVALAATLQLQGHPVTDEDILELYRHTAPADDCEVPILATLRAAAEFGLAGRHVDLGECMTVLEPAGMPLIPGLILGVPLPGGGHAVTVDPSGLVWSWGELYRLGDLDPGPADEAWAVAWS